MSEAEVSAAPREGLHRLMSARVDDTNIFDRNGRKLGTLHSVHIDRPSGQIEYAVLSIGGFLGLGPRYYPVPFRALSVNEEGGGYTVKNGKEKLQGGPRPPPDTAPRWGAGFARPRPGYRMEG